MTINIPSLLDPLAADRPVFHSEADFQHALAWTLHERHPDLSIRLELPVPIDGGRIYLDVWGRDADGKVVAIELKYKTRRLDITLQGENFALRGQAAQDCNRY